MPQVRREIVKDRARRLREKGAAALRAHLDAQVGASSPGAHRITWLGRTEHFTQVRLAAPVEPGIILDLTVAGHDGRQLLAA